MVQSFTSVIPYSHYSHFKQVPQFGCRYSMVVGEDNLPQNAGIEAQFTNNDPNHPRRNAPDSWLSDRPWLVGLFQNKLFGNAASEKLLHRFIGLDQDGKNKDDLFHGMVLKGGHNAGSSMAAIGAPDRNLKITKQGGSIAEQKQTIQSEVENAINHQARAYILHQRFATRGSGMHHFRANIDGVKVGFCHNGTVTGLLEVPELKNKIEAFHQKVQKDHSVQFDTQDDTAWKSGNDSYFYFNSILAHLEQLSGDSLNRGSFNTPQIVQAVSKAALEAEKAFPPAEYPELPKSADLSKPENRYKHVGYAGVFYAVRPDGSFLIMPMDGNKAPMIGVFRNQNNQHYLSIMSEASQPEEAYQKAVRSNDFSHLENWLPMPQGSGMVIEHDANPHHPTQVSTPFDLNQVAEGTVTDIPEFPISQLLNRWSQADNWPKDSSTHINLVG